MDTSTEYLTLYNLLPDYVEYNRNFTTFISCSKKFR